MWNKIYVFKKPLVIYLNKHIVRISAVKGLIVINRIQNKVFVCIIYVCVLYIFIMYIYKYTHMHVYITEKYVVCIYNINFMNINIYM